MVRETPSWATKADKHLNKSFARFFLPSNSLEKLMLIIPQVVNGPPDASCDEVSENHYHLIFVKQDKLFVSGFKADK
jgi:hypothetical protein